MMWLHTFCLTKQFEKKNGDSKNVGGKEQRVETSRKLLLSALLYQPSPSLPPTGLTGSSLTTPAPLASTPLEISTDLAAVAMVAAMAAGTAGCLVSGAVRALGGVWG